ncbi:MAG: HAMP domain-containing sensor histidine kinase [Acidimicrobiaceae bacterium]|nr:HAMP domain-containing sensor histidine kinase [Acidimicrobiaceae bacterium]
MRSDISKPTLMNRVSTRLYAGIGVAVVVTLSASLVGIWALQRIDDAQEELQSTGVDRLLIVLDTTKIAGDIVAVGTRLVTAADYDAYYPINNQRQRIESEFVTNLLKLRQSVTGQECDPVNDPDSDRCLLNKFIRNITSHVDTLSSNLKEIAEGMPRYYDLTDQLNEIKARIDIDRDRLSKIIDSEIDDKFFFILQGYDDLSDLSPAVDHLSVDELIDYRNLRLLKLSVNEAFDFLEEAYTAAFADVNSAAIRPLQEQFKFDVSRVEFSISNIRSLGDATNIDFEGILEPLLSHAGDYQRPDSNDASSDDIGTDIDYDNLFVKTEERLRILEFQQEALASNTLAALALVQAVADYTAQVERVAESATRLSTDTINFAKTVLTSISILGVIAAFLVSYLYVGRVILRRIAKLSHRMRELVYGDLETEVEVVGRDELADMASALEVFRQHALEVQRLNLLEKLTEELVDKNGQLEAINSQLENANKKLEDALDDLNTAQHQIVAREKLAALGEVTAGVAHEIRNPLNFIKNFSEVTGELLEELDEALEENAKIESEDEKEYISEILGDLQDNLKRIVVHSQRANRIVSDMLRMGRGASEMQLSDINNLLSDHAKLAYHSARAADPDFVLDLKEEFDPNMGQLEVTSQDLGRVFVNLVSNAGYTTNKKYQRLGGASNDDDYLPLVRLITSRTENEATIKVWDNGDGIPEDVIEKIFDPFFTTKPTDEGTGLGLSMAHDIIQSHGGTLRAISTPDECTEFTITIPLAVSLETAADDSPTAAEIDVTSAVTPDS